MRLARSRIVACGISLAVWTAVASGCDGAQPRAWGEKVDPAAAVPLSQLLSGDGVDPGAAVTASGRIGEVCRTAGCWFVLHDTRDGKLYEVLVDLKPGARFTVPPSVQGRAAVVRGRLVGSAPDLRLHAVGLRLE
jgi:hypothetical protein